MRLIDADKLHLADIESDFEAGMIIHRINTAPTVDAIPIEWILNNEKMPKDGKGRDAIMDMIEDWRKENETD